MTDSFEKAYGLAVRYLARRARSRYEMKKYLSGKAVDPDLIREVLARLEDLAYLDDRSFARQFIESRHRFKPKSRYALKYELKAKGIGETIADELLCEYDDLDLALRAVGPKKDQWNRLDRDTRKKKVMNYLRYRGFDYGVCLMVWEKLFSSF